MVIVADRDSHRTVDRGDQRSTGSCPAKLQSKIVATGVVTGETVATDASNTLQLPPGTRRAANEAATSWRQPEQLTPSQRRQLRQQRQHRLPKQRQAQGSVSVSLGTTKNKNKLL